MRTLLMFFIVPLLFSCNNGQSTNNGSTSAKQPQHTFDESFDPAKVDTATFAGGCFWCIEASFQQIIGVKAAISGYAGGEMKNPTYEQVSSGATNYAESVQVIYDPEVISYETLLDIFFTAHDPTQLNRQGPDEGRQYRSAIFYHNATQKRLAEQKMETLQKTEFTDEIVTQLNPYTKFWKAEEYHQNYEMLHPNERYVQQVSLPKINRVKSKFIDRVKEEYK